MATETTDDSIYLAHYGQEIDDCIDDVDAAKGEFETLAAKIADLTERIEALERSHMGTAGNAVLSSAGSNQYNVGIAVYSEV
jgi:hypothetical protein